MRVQQVVRIAIVFILLSAVSPVIFAAPKPAPKPTPAAAANDALEKAKATLNELTNKKRTAFEKTPEFVETTAAVKKSTAAYSAACAKFIATLQTSPEYKAVVAAKAAAQAKVDAMRKDPSNKPDVIAAAQSDAVDAAKAVTKFQTDAIDGNNDLSLLKDDVTISTHKLAEIKRKFEASMSEDPAWAAANNAVDKAEARLRAIRSKM